MRFRSHRLSVCGPGVDTQAVPQLIMLVESSSGFVKGRSFMVRCTKVPVERKLKGWENEILKREDEMKTKY